MEKWIEVFDLAKAGGRATEQDLVDIVETYDPNFRKAPLTIGHKRSYPKSTVIPAAGWVEAVKRVGQKLFILPRFNDDPSVDVPKEFKPLIEFARFFKDSVSKGFWKHRSISISGSILPGKNYLDHVAWLGAVPPQCEGMEYYNDFSSLPAEFASFAMDFSTNENDTKTFDFTEETIMNPNDKTKDFANIDLKDEADLNAVNEIVEMLISKFELPVDSKPSAVLAVLQHKQAASDKAKDEAAAIANQGISKPAVGAPSDFSKDEKAMIDVFSKVIRMELDPLKAKQLEMETKLRDFAEGDAGAGGSAAGASGDGGSAEPMAAAPESLGLKQADVDAKVDAAVNDLNASGNYIPQFDTTLKPLFGMLANVKADGGSALDKLVEGLKQMPKIADFAKERTVLENTFDMKEFSRREEAAKHSPKVEGLPTVDDSEEIGNEDEYKKVLDFSKKNNCSFEEAATKYYQGEY